MNNRRDSFDCPKCGRIVNFEVERLEHSVGEGPGWPGYVTDGDIANDDGCGVRLEAEKKGSVTQKDLVQCPYYANAIGQ